MSWICGSHHDEQECEDYDIYMQQHLVWQRYQLSEETAASSFMVPVRKARISFKLLDEY
jgi:hypothetical protein